MKSRQKTKVMNIDELVRTCEQKKQTGDYQTLARILNTNVDTARVRYYRKDEQAVRTLYRIVEHRDELYGEFQSA